MYIQTYIQHTYICIYIPVTLRMCWMKCGDRSRSGATYRMSNCRDRSWCVTEACSQGVMSLDRR